MGDAGAVMGDDERTAAAELEREGEEWAAQSGAGGTRRRSRAGRLWRRVKEGWELVEFHALPDYLRDNEFILRHYRPSWPIKRILLSTFTLHNETINIWTHLVGFLLFLGLTIYTAKMVPKVVEMPNFSARLPNLEDLHKVQSGLMTCLDSLPALPELHLPEMVTNCLPASLSPANKTEQCVLQTMRDDMTNFVAPLLQNPTNFVVPLLLQPQEPTEQRPTARWPFFIFLGGAMFCLLASATCHLLSCHSAWASYVLLRVDYAGIAALIAASFYPPVYYSFLCDPPALRAAYLGAITAAGVAAVAVSLVPVFQAPRYRHLRAVLFSAMAASGLVPCVHKLVRHGAEPLALRTSLHELLMGLFYGAGALIYAARVPERWNPGQFDLAGHSHQLFHVLVVLGAFTHYRAGLLYLKWRDLQGCT